MLRRKVKRNGIPELPQPTVKLRQWRETDPLEKGLTREWVIVKLKSDTYIFSKKVYIDYGTPGSREKHLRKTTGIIAEYIRRTPIHLISLRGELTIEKIEIPSVIAVVEPPKGVGVRRRKV